MTSTGKTAEADTAYIDAGKTLREAGHLMRDLGVGALGVRGENGTIQGTISDDMVVRRIAAGGDPKTVTVGEVAAVAPCTPPRPDGSGHDDHGRDPVDDQAHWEGAGLDRGWHWAVPHAPDTAGSARRKLPGLVALPVSAAGMVIPALPASAPWPAGLG